MNLNQVDNDLLIKIWITTNHNNANIGFITFFDDYSYILDIFRLFMYLFYI